MRGDTSSEAATRTTCRVDSSLAAYNAIRRRTAGARTSPLTGRPVMGSLARMSAAISHLVAADLSFDVSNLAVFERLQGVTLRWSWSTCRDRLHGSTS